MARSSDSPLDLAGSQDLEILQLAYDRLRQQQALQAGFLGTASHELRAPINQIISVHQLVLAGLCDSPEEERQFLQQAQTALQQVLQNLDLLIQVSKLELGRVRPEREPMVPALVLLEVQQLLHMKAENAQCRLGLGGDDLDFDVQSVGDDRWLRQALVALVEGAIAAGSRQISATLASSAERMTITLTCDGDPTCWQAPAHPAEAAETGLDRGLNPEIHSELSPGFRYQLAERIVAQLGGRLTIEPGDGSIASQLCLEFSQAAG